MPDHDRLAMIRRAAETDPYWRGYLAGLTDQHHVQPPQTAGVSSSQEDS